MGGIVQDVVNIVKDIVTDPLQFVEDSVKLVIATANLAVKPIEGLFTKGFSGIGQGFYTGVHEYVQSLGTFGAKYIPLLQDDNFIGSAWKRNMIDNAAFTAFLISKISLTVVSVALTLMGMPMAALAVSAFNFAIQPSVNIAYKNELMKMLNFKQSIEYAKELDAINNFTALSLCGAEIFDWLAGGTMYNECFAGGALFNSLGIIEPMSKGLGYVSEVDTSFLAKINFPFEDAAGGSFYNSYLAGGDKAIVDVLNFK